jgi:hypothetical protein
MLATVIIDQLIDWTDGYTHLERLGYIMTGSTCIPYAIAIVCFYRAGHYYSQFKTCLYYCKSATLDRVKIDDYLGHEVIRRGSDTVTIRKRASFIENIVNA